MCWYLPTELVCKVCELDQVHAFAVMSGRKQPPLKRCSRTNIRDPWSAESLILVAAHSIKDAVAFVSLLRTDVHTQTYRV